VTITAVWVMTLYDLVVGSPKVSQSGIDSVFRVEEFFLYNKLHVVTSQKIAVFSVTEDVNDVKLWKIASILCPANLTPYC